MLGDKQPRYFLSVAPPNHYCTEMMTDVHVSTKPPAISRAHPDARQRGFSEPCGEGSLFVVCYEADGVRPYCRDAPPVAEAEPYIVLVQFPRDKPPGVGPHSNAAVLYHGHSVAQVERAFNNDQLEVRDQEHDRGPGVPGIERAAEQTIAECGGNVMRALALHNQTESRRLDPAALETTAAAWLPRGPMPPAGGDATRAYLIDAARTAWQKNYKDPTGEQRAYALIALGKARARGSPAAPHLTEFY